MAKANSNGNGAKDSRKVNKSAAIREAIQANPNAKAKEIVEGLGKKGIKVTIPLVYYIKSHGKKKARKAKRATATAGYKGSGNAVDMVLSVKRLAAEAGGMESLRRLVDALAD